MAELNPQPLPPVRITIPASVAANLGKFQKSLTSVAERLGCPTCFSGADCHFQIERNFLINENLEAHAVAGASARSFVQEPDPSPWRTATASLPRAAKLEQIKTAVANIAGKLGCGQCCSGFDLQFQQETNVFRVSETGELRG